MIRMIIIVIVMIRMIIIVVIVIHMIIIVIIVLIRELDGIDIVAKRDYPGLIRAGAVQ